MNIERPQSKQPMSQDAKKVFSGIVFDVYHWEVDGYDGTKKVFEKIKRADTAGIIPITEDGKVILALEEQPGMQPSIGLLGGRIDEGEDPLAAAKRELLEETGYEASEWELFYAFQPTTKVDWAVFTFIAKGCKKVAEQTLDGAERIELKFFDFEQLVNLATDEEFGDKELKLRFLEAKLDPAKMEALKKQMVG
jgi:8-oxo-dGTP pyrophosphatase MutT (NUDIX family)